MKILSTNRLILRPMTMDDASTIVKWRNAEHISSVSHSTRQEPITLSEHEAWFTSTRETRIDYVIEIKSPPLAVGSLSYTWRDLAPYNKCAEIGKFLGEKQAIGTGIGFESSQRWIRFGFEDLEIDCIISRTREDNAANIRVNEKLGFSISDWPSDLESFGPNWLFMKLENSFAKNGSSDDTR